MVPALPPSFYCSAHPRPSNPSEVEQGKPTNPIRPESRKEIPKVFGTGKSRDQGGFPFSPFSPRHRTFSGFKSPPDLTRFSHERRGEAQEAVQDAFCASQAMQRCEAGTPGVRGVEE